ncbi:SRPBCC family protein [Pseudonocardia acidicola]|uniref:SRPBCC family protein n=1 Tax=Pseudonocardia acidicola TaxID=2724939 RepID=A0ABX1S7A4_9PSEU|nr:SRPBCC family protein [Pseudonocardia acidicola]NMH96348.1 SRPBCC family protein [Pseudonocardia acidicola]
MLIENEFRVTAPVDEVWDYMQDLPGLAPCLPGAELTDDLGDGTYQGKVITRLGPVKLGFTGTARMVEADEAARRIAIHAVGSEDKGKGTADMTVTATLVPASGGATTVKVTQDLQVSGAAAQYGRGMISDVSSVLMKSFAECISYNIDAGRGGGTATMTRTAKPASGLGIGLSAAVMALKRVIRRFFGPSTRP